MPTMTCDHCGRAFDGRRPARVGTFCWATACRREFNRLRQLDFVARKKEQGIDVYAPYRTKQKAVAREQGSNRSRWPQAAKAADQRRRARKYGVTCENFQSEEIYERDGWICGICHEPVDREVRYPDSASASLDHIIPLSLGGPHTRENTRLAHLGCNVARGAEDPGGEEPSRR